MLFSAEKQRIDPIFKKRIAGACVWQRNWGRIQLINDMVKVMDQNSDSFRVIDSSNDGSVPEAWLGLNFEAKYGI